MKPNDPNVYFNMGNANIPMVGDVQLPTSQYKYNPYSNYLPPAQKTQKFEFAKGGKRVNSGETTEPFTNCNSINVH